MKQFFTHKITKDSLFYKWCTPIKLISIFFYAFIIAFYKDPIVLLLSCTLSFIFIVLSKIQLVYFLSRLKNIIIFILVFSILIIISAGGEVLFTLKLFFMKINFYKDGIILSLLIFLRAVNIFMIFFLLFSTTKINAILHSLLFFRVPQNLALVFILTYRYIFRYFDDHKKMRTATILKGAKLKKNLLLTGHLYGNLFIRAYEDTNMIYKAMIMRGLNEKNPAEIKFEYNAKDLVIMYSILSFAIILLIIDKIGIIR